MCSVKLLIIHSSHHTWACHVNSGVTGTAENEMLGKGCQRNDLDASGGHVSKKASDFVN